MSQTRKAQRDAKARRIVLAALRQGATVAAAALAAGIARGTVYTWADRGDSQMRELLRARRSAGNLRGAIPKDAPRKPEPEGARDIVTSTLMELAQDPKARPQDRLRASLELQKLLPRRRPPPLLPEPPVDVSIEAPAAPTPPVDPTARFR